MTPTALAGTSPKSAPPDLRSPSPNSQNLGRAGDGQVASTGAACRMQIEQGTGIKARHPILWVRAALDGQADDMQDVVK